MAPTLLILVALGGAALFGGAALVIGVVVLMRRGRGGGGGRSGPAYTGPRMSPTQCWQAAGPSLAALGLRPVDAELCTRGFPEGGTLYLKFDASDKSMFAWVERAFPGGALEQFIGARAELKPGHSGGSQLAQLVAATVQDPFGALPGRARLTVKAPEMPGDEYKLELTSPLTTPLDPAAVARTLLVLDEAAHKPMAAGAHPQGKIPPAAERWMAAGPAIAALGFQKLDAQCYTHRFADDIGGTMYLKVDVREASVRGWVERAFPGGALEQFIGARAEVRPGHSGGSQLAQLVAATVQEPFGALPRSAALTVKAPEMPGDTYELTLTTPLAAPEHAALVGRVLLTLDEAVRRPIAAGAAGAAGAHVQSNVPVAAQHWMASAPGLDALGLRRMDAECYVHNFADGPGTLYVKLDVRDASVRGWVERACPGGALEGFIGKHTELRPGGAAHNELAQAVLATVQATFAALPRQAVLEVKAPEMPGASYSLTLTSPITSPEHAPLVARVLLTLDEAVRRSHGG